MNIIGFMPLHYGVSYIEYAIRSVIDVVDAFYCVYTPQGSFGWQADEPCPETEDELFWSASAAAGPKLRWARGHFPNETAHRDHIHVLEPDANVILAVDADDIWPPEQLARLLAVVEAAGVQRVRARGVHFWRSFYRAVVDDYAAPIRAICPKARPGETTADAYFAHMGYAQPERITGYKQQTHGHRHEWRPNWFVERFLPNAQRDVHPVIVDYWHPQPVNPRDYLPAWVVDTHPFAAVDIITNEVARR